MRSGLTCVQCGKPHPSPLLKKEREPTPKPLKRLEVNAIRSRSEVTPKEWFETYGSNPN